MENQTSPQKPTEQQNPPASKPRASKPPASKPKEKVFINLSQYNRFCDLHFAGLLANGDKVDDDPVKNIKEEFKKEYEDLMKLALDSPGKKSKITETLKVNKEILRVIKGVPVPESIHKKMLEKKGFKITKSVFG